MWGLVVALLLCGDDRKAALYLWDRGDGSLSVATLEPKPGLDCVEAPDWGPDSRTLYFHAGPEGGYRHQPRREGASVFRTKIQPDGSAGPIEDLGAGAFPAASPDGRLLAISDAGSVVLANADGSGRRTLGTAEVARWGLLGNPDGGPPVTDGRLLVRTANSQLGQMSIAGREVTPIPLPGEASTYVMDFQPLPDRRALVVNWTGSGTVIRSIPLRTEESEVADPTDAEALFELPYEGGQYVTRACLLPGDRTLGVVVLSPSRLAGGNGRLFFETELPLLSVDQAVMPLRVPDGVGIWDIAYSPDGRYAAFVSNAWYADPVGDSDGPIDLAVRKPESVGEQAGAVEQPLQVGPLGADVDQ